MKSLLAVFIALVTTGAWALPEAPFDALSASRLKTRDLSQAFQYDFEGIVKLSNCSGSLVAFSGMPMTAKAVVMTNGHCIQKPGGYLEPGEVWVDRPLSRAMKLFDRAMKLHSIRSTRILYATMTDTDVAFYELDKSYLELMNATGVRPFMLDSFRPGAGEDIEIISGYWDRGYSCAIDAFVPLLKEGSWSWTDSIRYTEGCDTIGGTSGSPIIAKGEKRVIGINNTSNRDGGTCTLNNPCEVNEQGDVVAAKGARYGQQTYSVYTCLTPDFEFDLELEDCRLPR